MDAFWRDGFPGEAVYGDPIPEDDRGRDNSYISPKEIADVEEIPHAWLLISVKAYARTPEGELKIFGRPNVDVWIPAVTINNVTYLPDSVAFVELEHALSDGRRCALAIAAMIDHKMWRLGWAPMSEED